MYDAIFDYSSANWQEFKNHINSRINLTNTSLDNINTPSQIDAMIESIASLITSAHEAAVPKKAPERYNLVLSDDILSLIKIRNIYRKKSQRQSQNATFKQYYKFLKNLIEKKISEARNSAWSKNLESMNSTGDNNKKLWKFVNIIKSNQRTIPALKKDGRTLITAVEKWEAFKSEFVSAHNLTTQSISQMEDEVDESIRLLHTLSEIYFHPIFKNLVIYSLLVHIHPVVTHWKVVKLIGLTFSTGKSSNFMEI